MHTVKKILKFLGAGIVAFGILCGLSSLYYLEPMHQPSKLKNTDFVWPAHAPWIQMLEGISWGRFDGWGFNNPEVISQPDVVVLGSSHMEAKYVRQDQLLSCQLEKLLGDGTTVYNMGISGCHLPQTLQYLPQTLEAFSAAPGLLLIETHDLTLSQEQIDQILSGEVPSIFENASPLKQKIMGLPYLRLLAYQKNVGLLNVLNPPRKPEDPGVFTPPGEPLSPDSPEGKRYDPLFSWLKQLQDSYGVEILFFYQPTEELQKDGSVFYPQDPMVRVFAEKCRENGMGFLNLTDEFEKIYHRDHLLPHGFTTGKIGTGHLNAVGHQAIAHAVFDWIQKEGISLCR